MLADTRSRVYLLWTILAPLGFLATHYYQQHIINALWTTISVIGLGFMYRVMPLRVKQMRNIFMSWLVPIAFGMVVSAAVFYSDSLFAAQLLGHLGAFWLGVMAVAYFWNGIVDRPMAWYVCAAVINAVACVLCFTVIELAQVQYIIAAIVTAWSMLNLLLFRTDVLS